MNTTRASSSAPVEVIEEILSDSEEDDGSVNASNLTSRQRRKRAAVDYTKFYDSDDEKAEVRKNRETLANSSHEIQNTAEFLEYLSYYPEKVKSCENLFFFDYDTQTDSIVTLFKKCGKYVKQLSFGTIGFQLLRHIQELCPKLESLKIRVSKEEKYQYTMQGSTHALSERRTYPQFARLLELHLESNSFLSNKEDFTNLLKACKNIEKLFLSFGTIEELTNALALVTEHLTLTSLRALAVTFGKESEYEEEVVLRRSHILQLAMLSSHGAALEKLELIAGIWEDVRANDLQTLMSNYARTMKHFTIAGNLHGIDLDDKQLVVVVPRLDKLLSFAMGSSYEFEEVDESSRNTTSASTSSNSAPRNNIISLTEKHLISFIVNFQCIMPSLETLHLGNLIEIDKIHPMTFPRIRIFRVASTWNKSIDLPVEGSFRAFPVFPFVRELQFPDCMRDEFLVQKTRKLFPNVRKVWINLPSVKCLKHFLNAMSESQISELHLKTQYDFENVLECALLAKPCRSSNSEPGPSSSTSMSGSASLRELMKLKNPEDGDKVFNEFLRYHNIELPLSDDEILQSSVGIGSLSTLRALYLEHIPRKLKIPTNPLLPHYHHLQTFHPTLTIGFKYYPLSEKFFSDEFQHLQNLEIFNYGNNFKGPKSVVLPSMCVYSGHSGGRNGNIDVKFDLDAEDDRTWGSSIASHFGETGSTTKSAKKLKVKILPSTLANDQFRVKPEKLEETEMETSTNSSATMTLLSAREIKNESTSDEE